MLERSLQGSTIPVSEKVLGWFKIFSRGTFTIVGARERDQRHKYQSIRATIFSMAHYIIFRLTDTVLKFPIPQQTFKFQQPEGSLINN